LTLALTSPPGFAQAPNPDLLKASWDNLYKGGTALESYFADFARYPQSAVELMGIGGRQYIAKLPVEPCTGAGFGFPPGYTYGPVGNPATSYVLRTNWVAGGYGAICYAANGNANVEYSPGKGFQLTP
jgi:hypothetical protein